jgi:hypothetical protein
MTFGVLPHIDSLPGQMQMPFLQISVGAQTAPEFGLVAHPPQCAGFVALSTQLGGVPHMICVVTDPHGKHAPPMQLAVAPQDVPQAPQLFWSLLKSTHAPPAAD